jgi:hypothetical protein
MPLFAVPISDKSVEQGKKANDGSDADSEDIALLQ